MNARPVIRMVSFVLIVLGAAMAVCAFVGWEMNDPPAAVQALTQSALACLAVGLAAWLFSRGSMELSRRDGFGVVAFGWLAAGVAGAAPYVLSDVIPSAADALFESVSGFTTTGASVLSRLETVPRGLLLWRATTHFFGGMGVLVLCVAVLPLLGTGGMQIFRAEMPGPSKDRLSPRIATTAKLLWGVYVLLVLLETLMLRVGGMDWFDAVCHSFATMATGGFSTRSASAGAFHSPLIETVLIAFMFLAGVNFALHYRLLAGAFGAHIRDAEFRFYLAVWLIAGLLITVLIAARPETTSWGEALRAAFFQTTSILTTTGFVTADFNAWPNAARWTLVLLMFFGGCAGSTGGGMKNIRVFVVLKHVLREVRLAIFPQSVVRVKISGEPLDEALVSNIVGFVVLFLGIFAVATLGMTFFTPDLETALTSVSATLCNVGPGLAGVGPTQTYAAIPAAGKLLLIACMLLGRLELFTLVVLFLPRFWRR